MHKIMNFLKALALGLLAGMGLFILGFNLMIYIDYIYIPIITLLVGVIITYLITLYYYHRFEK